MAAGHAAAPHNTRMKRVTWRDAAPLCLYTQTLASGRGVGKPGFPIFTSGPMRGAHNAAMKITISWEGAALPNPPTREGCGETRFPHSQPLVGAAGAPQAGVWGNPVSPYFHLRASSIRNAASRSGSFLVLQGGPDADRCRRLRLMVSRWDHYQSCQYEGCQQQRGQAQRSGKPEGHP